MAQGLLFGRYAKLSIGLRNQTGKSFESISKDAEGNIVQGLRIRFKIEKTSDPLPNKAQIDIYNLAPDTIKLLQKPGCTVTLEAGYTGFNQGSTPTKEVIFRGDVMKSTTQKQGTDYVTTIENGDGLAAFQSSQFNGSFSAGTEVSGVLDSVISSFGLGKGEVQGVGGQFLNGATFSGSSKDVMDQITGKTGSEWSIQNGQIQILPINSYTKLPAIVLQSSYSRDGNAIFDEQGNPLNTGLVGSPTLSGFSHSKEKKFSGVEFKSLLQPGLAPGRRVKVVSKNVAGVFVVRKVTHDGDSANGPWFSECEGGAI